MTDPFALFDEWYAQARETELNDSNAMALLSLSSVSRACAYHSSKRAKGSVMPLP